MPDRVTLDVIDRPAGGLPRVLARARAARHAAPPGMRALMVVGTGHFVTRVRPSPTPLRVALLAAWDESDEVQPRWERAIGAMCERSAEHWHVEAEVARAAYSGPWRGWTPDVSGARPLDRAEPALILISGNLRGRHVPAFMKDVPAAVAQAFAHPGYLGGLAINSSPLNTTSCSCWRTYADAQDYAFRSGDHAEAMRRDRADDATGRSGSRACARSPSAAASRGRRRSHPC